MRSITGSTRGACLLCAESITNPVCYGCLQSEIEDWLSDRMPKLVARLRKAGGSFKSYTYPVTDCMLCGNNMNVCSQCYCREVTKLFENYPRLGEEFLEFFNFELRGDQSMDLET